MISFWGSFDKYKGGGGRLLPLELDKLVFFAELFDLL